MYTTHYSIIILSLLYSHYGCNIWGITTAENLGKIIKLQKKCVRILTFADFDAHANPLFIELKILKIHDVIKLQQLKLAYEYCNNLIPSDLHTLFHCTFDSHPSSLPILKSHHNSCLSLPTVKTLYHGTKSLRFQCVLLWNHFRTKTIPIREKQLTTGKNVNFNLDWKKIFNIHQFLRVIKKHFRHMCTHLMIILN